MTMLSGEIETYVYTRIYKPIKKRKKHKIVILLEGKC